MLEYGEPYWQDFFADGEAGKAEAPAGKHEPPAGASGGLLGGFMARTGRRTWGAVPRLPGSAGPDAASVPGVLARIQAGLEQEQVAKVSRPSRINVLTSESSS